MAQIVKVATVPSSVSLAKFKRGTIIAIDFASLAVTKIFSDFGDVFSVQTFRGRMTPISFTCKFKWGDSNRPKCNQRNPKISTITWYRRDENLKRHRRHEECKLTLMPNSGSQSIQRIKQIIQAE